VSLWPGSLHDSFLNLLLKHLCPKTPLAILSLIAVPPCLGCFEIPSFFRSPGDHMIKAPGYSVLHSRDTRIFSQLFSGQTYYGWSPNIVFRYMSRRALCIFCPRWRGDKPCGTASIRPCILSVSKRTGVSLQFFLGSSQSSMRTPLEDLG
jgi:hypothetical protein